MSFLGVLHHASHHLAKTRGASEETPQIIGFKYRSLKLLNERMAAAKGPYHDGTIIAVGLLANAEVYPSVIYFGYISNRLSESGVTRKWRGCIGEH